VYYINGIELELLLTIVICFFLNKHMGDPASPSQSESNTQSNQKRGRGRTQMKNLKIKTTQGKKLPIEIQSNGLPSWGKCKKVQAPCGFLCSRVYKYSDK
jgi:hypothetical protein